MPDWLAEFLARLTPSCKEMTRLLSDSMERRLPLPRRFSMRLHFLICKWCKRYQGQLLFIRGILRRQPEKLEEAGTASLSPQARERIKQALTRRKP